MTFVLGKVGGKQDLTDAVAAVAAADQIAVSVGPYRFHSSTPVASNLAARSRDRASPPQKHRRSGAPCQSAASSICHVAGVACITFAPDAPISASSEPEYVERPV